ncbi:MAG: CapA family protein [Actinomycetes bacterium]|jgi:poly-gamma-glutamate synthesis protein (capsule biosynthesis protein)
MRASGIVSAALLAVFAASCSIADPTSGEPGSRPPSAVVSSPASDSATASAPAQLEVPLALVMHPTRSPLDIDVAAARDLLDGRITSWSELGAAGGRLRVVTGVDEVERDLDAVAAIPATAVGPTVRVVTVDHRHPLRDPDRYPLSVPVPAGTGPTSIGPVTTVALVGDVMLGRRVGRALAAADNFAAVLEPTRRRLATADVTAGNLESTLSMAGAPRQGGDSFAADPRVLAGLRRAGFDVLSLANNHTGDFGSGALIDTVDRVAAARIAPVGAGRNLDRARRPAVVERNGIKFGFLAFNAIGETPAAGRDNPGAARIRMPPRTGPLNEADLRAMRSAVRRLDASVDVVLVLPHWGGQYTNRPEPAQRRVARALIDAGADLIVGGHPHWVQGVELYRDRLIAHSLGNYVFDMDFSRQTREGVILELTFWGSELKAAEFVPVVIGSDFAPRMVTGRTAEPILRRIWQTSGRPFSVARSAAPR